MLTVLAQTNSNCAAFRFGGCSEFIPTVNAAFATFFAVVWFVAIVFLAYGALLYITSAGDKAKADTAKQALTNALIGIVVILSINILTSIVSNFFQGGSAGSTPTLTTSVPRPGTGNANPSVPSQ